ncbi:hypothetical protein BGX28_010067 [Mortierella sp. GBA30]|nr:hypothetical protein BGX28_010067 [Mortierella sp. GBA30]
MALAAVVSLTKADGETPAAFDCAKIEIEGHSYDISAFKPLTFTAKGEPRDEHPSKIRVDYMLNPCQAIPIPEGEAGTHCKTGTWVCQDTKLVKGEGEPETIFLKTIAGSAPATDKELAPSAIRAEKRENVEELPWNLTLKGGVIDGRDQSAVITFICDHSVTDPKLGLALDKYDGAAVYFSWKSSFACPAKDVRLPTTEGMSGFSVFLTVVAVLGIIYLAAGAVYNYHVYGARGLDMLPNLGKRISLRLLERFS